MKPGVRIRPFALSLLTLSGVGAPVVAQSRDTVRLPEIVVTATRLAVPREEVPNAVTVLDGAELGRRGVTRVVDALREVPGLSVVQSGAAGSVTSLFMRGGESDYVRVLVDGVPVNQPGGSVNLADLDMSNVDRVEVVRGPVSALYGSDAVAGVVQIFTRGGERPGVAMATHFMDGGAAFDARLAGGTPRLGFSVGAASRSEPGTFPVNHRYGAWSAGALLRAVPDAGTDIRFSVRHQDGVYHYPTNSSGYPADSNQFTSGVVTVASVEAGRVLSGRVETRLLLGFTGGADRAADTPDSPGESDSYDNRTKYERLTADLRANVRALRRGMVTAGVAVEQQRFRNVLTYGGVFDGTPYVGGDTIHVTRSNQAVYVQALAPLGARATAMVGGRLEHNERFGEFATVRAGLTARPLPGTVLRASAGTGFKEPTMYEHYGSGFSTGNRGLAPERSISGEVGAEQRLTGAVLAATVFAQRFSSLIEYAYHAGPDTSDYVNIGGADACGLELEGHFAPRAGAALTVEWTLLGTTVRDAGEFNDTFVKGRPLLRRPAHRASLTLVQRFGRFDASVASYFVGRREDLDFGGGADVGPDRVTLPSYMRLDLSAAGSVTRAITATVRIENALDERYQEVRRFAAPRRTIWLGASYHSGH